MEINPTGTLTKLFLGAILEIEKVLPEYGQPLEFNDVIAETS